MSDWVDASPYEKCKTMLLKQAVMLFDLKQIETAAKDVCISHLKQSRSAAPPIAALLKACGYKT